ncbi:arabinose transporter [Methylobacterium mesophilicum]
MTSPELVVSALPDRSLRCLYRLSLALFVGYLCIAMALPVVSVFVTARLGYGNGLAGVAVGIAFASTIVTRGMAGHVADGRGSRYCMLRGLVIYIAASLISAAAGWPGFPAPVAYVVLLAGRLLLGVGESFVVVGAISWCFGVTGLQRSGLVFGVVGMALYAAFAVGSPVGVALFEHAGFVGTMAACMVAPLIALLMALPVAPVPIHPGERPSFLRIVGRISGPGAALALQGVGSAAIGAFVALMFLDRGWPYAGLGLTCFGGAFVLARIVAGHLPDRVGSIPVALGSMAVEAVGQFLLSAAPNPVVALAGAVLTGLGCSLMFPAMGIEVVRRVPAHLRGTAAGGLAMFQDLAFGLTGPVTGVLADRFDYGAVFLVGGVAAVLSFLVVIGISRRDHAQGA